MAGRVPLEGPLVLEAVFVFVPPASWPKKRLAEVAAGREPLKQTRPDLKNLLAGVEDGMNGIAWKDDGQVANYGQSRKVFGARAETRITITAVEETHARPANQPALALA
jgi:Holliday junction resolvase RusA-like endonuclease